MSWRSCGETWHRHRPRQRKCCGFETWVSCRLATIAAAQSTHEEGLTMKKSRITLNAMNVHSAAASLCLSLLALTANPAGAASSTASSAAEGASSAASSGSKSSQQSSASSSNEKTASAGDYRIIDVAAVPDQAGMVRLQLQAATAQGQEQAFLVLPQKTFEKTGLSTGQMVTAREHAYGLEFADHKTKQAFFLVLTDEWYRELNSQSLVL